VSKHADELAGIIVTPYRHEAFHDQELPVPEFHSTIRNLCDDHGIVYILDDVRCGFRLDLAGSGHYYGTEPDLSCYCKALGNGYPISALMGREALRGAAQQVFMTGSYWMSSLELAAAVATVNELERIDGCRRMREYGIRLRTGLARQAAEHGLEVRLTGEPGLPFMTFADDSVFERAKLWCAECIRRGVFFHPSHNWFLTTAHGDAELEATLEATGAAFEAVAQKFRA
jgi:glutamate-1-semialdehyde 2,1-aminomutase